MKKLIVLFSICVAALAARAEVKLPYIFGNNMVLQQHTDAAIWGTAKPNATLTLQTTWSKQKHTAKVDANGKWKLKIATPKAGGPYEITLSDGASITLKNVMVGEVWLASGQSNMEMPMKGFYNQPTAGANEAILRSTNPSIRHFYAPRSPSLTLEYDFSKETTWKMASYETTGEFSATAYFFAQLLNEVLNVPVGIICIPWGGSSVEAWMSKDALADFPHAKIPQTKEDIKPANRAPSVLYSGMINPVVGIAIKGCLWYQGEANVHNPEMYQKMFPKMVETWRSAWGIGEFPFYYVQIAPYRYAANSKNSAFLRDAQRKCETIIPNSGMAVTLDVGEANNIHPANKKAVGERLALQALAKTYGLKGFAYASPSYKEMKMRNDTIDLTFDNAESGFIPFQSTCSDFEVAGENKKFYPAKLLHLGTWSKPSTIAIKSDSVPQPVAVRYAFKDVPQACLISTFGLPVSSFRTDEWE